MIKPPKIEIDFVRKMIRVKQNCFLRQLYSYLQDVFDEPENMKFAIPIRAVSRNKYQLMNGWKIDPAGHRFLKGGALGRGQARAKPHVLREAKA